METNRKRKREESSQESREKRSASRAKRLEGFHIFPFLLLVLITFICPFSGKGAEITENYFLGTEATSGNFEWLTENKITHIVNCAKETANLFEPRFPEFSINHSRI